MAIPPRRSRVPGKVDPGVLGSTLLSEMLLDSPGALWPCTSGSGAPLDVAGGGYHLTLAAGANTYYSDAIFGSVLDLSVGSWTTTYRCPQTAYSLSAWVYMTGTASDTAPVADWGGDNAYGAMIHIGSSNALSGYHRGTQVTGGNLAGSTWNHIVFTWDGSALKLYLNGSQVNTGSNGTAPGTANGSGSASRISSYGMTATGRRTQGRGRFLAWYPTALSLSRVQAHYNVGLSSN